MGGFETASNTFPFIQDFHPVEEEAIYHSSSIAIGIAPSKPDNKHRCASYLRRG
jgi:hypothetical protein